VIWFVCVTFRRNSRSELCWPLNSVNQNLLTLTNDQSESNTQICVALPWVDKQCHEFSQTVLPKYSLYTGYKIDDDSNILATSCSIDLLDADNIRLTCWNNLLRVCWPRRPCYKMITTCSRLVNNWKQAERTQNWLPLTSFMHRRCTTQF
jgi:hypothetical protein